LARRVVGFYTDEQKRVRPITKGTGTRTTPLRAVQGRARQVRRQLQPKPTKREIEKQIREKFAPKTSTREKLALEDWGRHYWLAVMVDEEEDPERLSSLADEAGSALLRGATGLSAGDVEEDLQIYAYMDSPDELVLVYQGFWSRPMEEYRHIYADEKYRFSASEIRQAYKELLKQAARDKAEVILEDME